MFERVKWREGCESSFGMVPSIKNRIKGHHTTIKQQFGES